MRVKRSSHGAVLAGTFALIGALWGGFLGVRQVAGIGSALDRFEFVTLDLRFAIVGAQPAPRGVTIAAIDEETIREALTGNYRAEHVFGLKQALELWDFHQAKVAECDIEIEAVLKSLNQTQAEPERPIPAVRHAIDRNRPLCRPRTNRGKRGDRRSFHE